MRAMQLEAEIRTDPARHADRFVERWNKLSGLADRAYVTGDIVGRKSARNEMAEMAKSLEREPQLEPLLAARTAEQGLSIDFGGRPGAGVGVTPGFACVRGRGVGRSPAQVAV